MPGASRKFSAAFTADGVIDIVIDTATNAKNFLVSIFFAQKRSACP
jgi:hypothetical protein